MISSRRCSSSSRAIALALLVSCATGMAGCRHGAGPAVVRPEPADGDRLRVVLLPFENLSGASVSFKDLATAIEIALRRRVEVVSGDIVEQFLAQHRLRYTGGIDAEVARAARDELGADAIAITSVFSYRPVPFPLLGVSMRLVATGEEPTILWMETSSRVGDENPGLLRLGIIDSMREVQALVVDRLTASLDRFLAGRRPDDIGCGGPGFWNGPRVRYRAPLLDDPYQYSLAVLPLLNRSGRRGAGEAMELDFIRQLVATVKYKVLEPGVVRDLMLRYRIIIPGGVSLEATRLLLGGLGVELVVSGTVFDFDEAAGAAGSRLQFSATMLDGGTGEVVWQSTSTSRGDDGVFAFGLGRIATVGRLSCRMVAGVVSQLADPSKFSSNTPPRRSNRKAFGVFEKSASAAPSPPADERGR